MSDLENVLNGQDQNNEPPEVVAEQTQEPALETQAEPETQQSPPTGEKHDKTVPLEALEAVRKEKTDWKEKAIRAEAELKAFRETQQQQPQQEQQPVDPYTFANNLALNERLNMSEMLARKDHPDMDEKLAIFEMAADQNPALAAELKRQTHPWEWVYQQGKKLQMLQEMGDDPESYRKKLEDEIRAKVEADYAQQQPVVTTPGVTIPQSLAGTRSAGARSATQWTGPTPLNSIIK
jgi:hypothetical protein